MKFLSILLEYTEKRETEGFPYQDPKEEVIQEAPFQSAQY